MNRAFLKKIFIPVCVGVLSFFTFTTAFAAISITQATGGSAISADTAGGSYTVLTGPTILEGSNKDFGLGTFIFNAPAGFQWNTGANVTAVITRVAGSGTCFSFTNNTVTPTANAITYNVSSRDTTGSTRCRVVFSNMQVRPTASTPLATGVISTSGTASVNGVTSGVTPFGSLTEVAGAKNKLTFTTQPNATIFTNTDFTTKPVVTLQDQFGNTVTTDNTSAITRTAVLSTQACGGTVGSGTLSSTPLNGAAVVSGVMDYTAMQYSAQENIKICASSAGVTSALSNAIAVTKITTTTSLGTTASSQAYGTSVTFTATVAPTSGGPATGSVSFYKNGVLMGTGTLSSGIATYSTSTLDVLGSPHSITATYGGDANFLGSSSNTVSQTITTKALTVSGMTVSNKTYDTFTTATLNGGLLVGVVGSDVISIGTRTGNFADKNVGTGKTVTVTAITLTGADAGNYTVTLPSGITANITTAPLTVTGMTASNKPYDGNQTVTLSGGTLVGVIGTDIVSISTRTGTFANKNVGTAKTVTVSSVTLSGADAGNYTVTLPTGLTADITAIGATVTGITANNKTYDGNRTATLNTVSAILHGIISGDSATLDVSNAAALFDTATVGIGKTVTISGLALSGVDAGNYTLAQPTAIADITNPVPTITNLNPNAKNVNDAGFTLTVNGTNFLNNSVVNWNGVPKTTTYVSATSVTIPISSSDLLSAGIIPVTVTNPGPGGGTSNSQNFTIVQGASQFVILAPTNGTVDGVKIVTVQAQKPDGSIDANYQNDVTLNTSGSATGGGLVNIVNGVGTMQIADHVAETVHLTLTDSQSTGLAISSSQDLVFLPGTVTSYVLNNPGNMNARTRLGYQVTRKDQYGNSVTANALTAYLYTNSTSVDKKFYDDSLAGNAITSVTFLDGTATANFWYYDDLPGTYTITVSDSSSAPNGAIGIIDATRAVTVIPVAVKFVISSAGSSSVDSPLIVTVQAEKSDNTVDTSFQDDVTLQSTGSAIGAGLVNIVNGVGTKSLSNTVAETSHLTLLDSQGTGLDVSSSVDVVWQGGATTQFSLNHPSTLSAGNRAAYTVSRKDQYGNVTSQGDITAYLYTSSSGANKKFYDAATGGNVITSVIIPAGQQSASFWYYDEKPGVWSITASDSASAPNGASGISDAVDALTVVPGAVGTFVLNTPGDMTAKTRLGYIVTRKDQFGNLVTSGDTTVYLYTSAGALNATRSFYDAATSGNSISQLTIANGADHSSFWYYEETPGNYTVSASDNATAADGINGVIDGTANVIVSPAPIVATKFVILTPSNGTVDGPVTITIQAQDSAGNLDTTATSSVTLITSGSATGAGVVTMTGGIGTIQISDHNAEVVHLSLSDSQSTGLDVSSTQNVTFATGAAKQFTIDNPGDTAAGTRLGFTITRKDQFGNLITSGITTAYLYTSSTGVNKKFYDAANGGSVITSVNILEGQSSAQFWYYDELAGPVTVTISDAATSPDGAIGITDTARTFTVTPAAISKFIMDNPGNMTAGTRIGYTLTRKDQFDNLVTSGVVSAYLYTSSTGTSTKFYDASTGGFPTSMATFADSSSIAHFWYYDEAPGTWVITASDSASAPNGALGIQDATDSVTVSLAPIVATKFVIQPVSNSTINIPATVTIRAEDNNGNVDATYNHNVTLNVSGSAIGGGLVTIVNGVGTATINDAVAEIVNLSLSDSQSTGLSVSSFQSLTFNSVYVPPVLNNGSSGGETTYAMPVISGFRFSGKAFPSASLRVIALGGTANFGSQNSVANSMGTFTVALNNLAGSANSFGIIGTDKNNNTTQVKIFDANQANSALHLDVNGILLSPTLGLSRTAVTKGDVLGIIGAAVPSYKIEVQVDNQPTSVTTTADGKGLYKVLVPTGNLSFGSHTIRTRQIAPSGLKSDYSPQEVFSVVNIFTPNMDFNGDGTIGVQDYSIFVTRWQSSDPKVRMKDDLNGDGKTDVQDLSIFMRTLKVK